MARAYDKPREGPIDDRALPPQGGAEPRVRGVCASFPHINTLDNPWDNLPGTRRTAVTPRGLRLIDPTS